MRFITFVIVWTLQASPTEAHMGVEGLSNFANGALHPILVPAHAMLIATIALLAGRQGYPWVAKSAVAVFIGLMIGLAVITMPTGAHAISEARIQQLILTGGVLSGMAVAISISMPRTILLTVTAMAGCVIGMDSGYEADSTWIVAQTYAGTAVSTPLAVVYLAGVTAEIFSRRPLWMQIGVRIIGSWIAAIAILVLALLVAGPSAVPKKPRSATHAPSLWKPLPVWR